MMKRSKLTLDTIRREMTPFQKELFQEIWQHFCESGKWPILRELYSTYGKKNVRRALTTLGKGIGHEESDGERWPRYRLSLLGVLLAKDGLMLQKLMARFSSFNASYSRNSRKRTCQLLPKLQPLWD